MVIDDGVKLIKAREAAERAGVTPETVTRVARNGRIFRECGLKPRKLGRDWYVPDAWVYVEGKAGRPAKVAA